MASPQMPLAGSKCNVAQDYNKRPFVLTLELSDKSVYLIQATSSDDMVEWIKALNYAAGNPRL